VLLADRYRIIELLGQGGMGSVYRGFDERLKRPVAIKVLQDPRHDERFRREARAVARLSNEHVAKLLDFVERGPNNEEAFLVLELVEGETLAKRLRANLARDVLLTWQEALGIASQIAEALAAAHAAKIVHRDIKPANVMLVSPSDFVKVLDFGIAKLEAANNAATMMTAEHVPQLTATGDVLGTITYMAPEQARGEPDVGPPADVFALGVVLYGMLAHELPHRNASTPAEILGSLVRGELVPIEERCPMLPKDVLALVERALALSPSDRFPDGAAMHAAIEAARRVEPPLEPKKPKRPPVSAPFLVGFGAVLILGIAIGAVLFAQRRRPIAPLPPPLTMATASTPEPPPEEIASSTPIATPSSSSSSHPAPPRPALPHDAGPNNREAWIEIANGKMVRAYNNDPVKPTFPLHASIFEISSPNMRSLMDGAQAKFDARSKDVDQCLVQHRALHNGDQVTVYLHAEPPYFIPAYLCDHKTEPKDVLTSMLSCVQMAVSAGIPTTALRDGVSGGKIHYTIPP